MAKYSPEEIAYVALQQWGGFSGQGVPRLLAKSAVDAVAVALAESGGDTNAHNSKPPDDSYGLWQINMYGSLGPSRRAKFKLSNNEELFLSQVNARVAHGIWAQSGNSFNAWSTYKDGSYRRHLDKAGNAVENPKKPGNVGGGPDSVDTQIGGKLIDAVFDPIISFIKEAGLRLAGFIGGAALLIGALILVAKRGVK